MQRVLQSREVLAGLLLAGIGALYLCASIVLPIGSAVRMGSGYFPLIVSALLIAVGILTALAGLHAQDDESPPVPWLSLVLVIASIIAFAALVRTFGLVPAVLATAMLSCFATGKLRVTQALVVAVLLAAFCWVVFIVGLGLALEPFAWPSFG